MKKISIVCLTLILAFMFGFTGTNKAYSEEKAYSIPVSMSYMSAYWWRGYVLDGGGYFWPGVGFSYGDLSISAAAGVPEEWITAEDSGTKKDNKALTEIDLGVAYSIDAGIVGIDLGVMYIGYPYYDAADKNADDYSFIEGSVTVTANTILSPYVSAYYDYYLEESADKTPTDEDYYVKLGVSQDLISTDDGFAFSLGAYVGYYNNAMADASGWSDAVVTASTSKDYKNVNFSASFNYGRVLGKDFENDEGIKNYFWSTFGATVTL